MKIKRKYNDRKKLEKKITNFQRKCLQINKKGI